jgi:hypothetical protein
LNPFKATAPEQMKCILLLLHSLLKTQLTFNVGMLHGMACQAIDIIPKGEADLINPVILHEATKIDGL